MKQESDETWQFKGVMDMSNATEVRKNGSLSRDVLAQTDLSELPIALTRLKVWDDQSANLPGTAATDDLGVIEGTWGTDAPTVQTSDAKATTVTQRAFLQVPIEHDYELGETVQIRIRAGMITTVSDTTATVDIEVYEPDLDGAVGSDLCTTAAQSINSLTKANLDFTITAGGLTIGSELLCRVTIAITDGATATAVIGEISYMALLKDIRG